MKVLIHAYVAQNLGDDLFISLICERYRRHVFYLFADYRYQYPNIPNLITIPVYPLPRFIRRVLQKAFKVNLDQQVEYMKLRHLQKKYIKEMDMQIWLGGSQFVETKHWQRIIAYKKFQQSFTLPFVSISATAGPFRTEEYKKAAIDVIREYDDICFRDKKSYEITGKLPNARYEMDMVYSISDVHKIKKRKIIVSLIDVCGKFSQELGIRFEEKICEILNEYNKRGYSITFLSCCSIQKDSIVSRKVMNNISNPGNICLLEFTGNIEKVISEICQAEYMIACRYHANVLGLRYGLKVLPIIYEDKTEFMLHTLNRQGVQLEDVSDIDVDSIDKYFVQLTEDEIETCKQSAQRQYKAIDEQLREK